MEHEEIMAMMKGLIKIKKQIAFVKGYEATDAEALGILISQYFEWNGIEILETCKWALEDANFHKETDKIEEIIDSIKRK